MGKTELIKVYQDRTDEPSTVTIFDTYEQPFSIDNKNYCIRIFDTAGQENLRDQLAGMKLQSVIFCSIQSAFHWAPVQKADF